MVNRSKRAGHTATASSRSLPSRTAKCSPGGATSTPSPSSTPPDGPTLIDALMATDTGSLQQPPHQRHDGRAGSPSSCLWWATRAGRCQSVKLPGLHIGAAARVDHLASQVRRVVSGEERRYSRDVSRLGDPAKRDLA